MILQAEQAFFVDEGLVESFTWEYVDDEIEYKVTIKMPRGIITAYYDAQSRVENDMQLIQAAKEARA